MKVWSTPNGYAITIGWLIALVILILAIVFIAVGRMDLFLGGMLAGLAISRLL